jgi:hypothetical protein
MRRSGITLILLIVVLATDRSEAQATHAIAVDVRDQVGAVISAAEVIVHQDRSGAVMRNENEKLSDQTIATDHLGVAHVSAPDGFFDVCVMASAFTPACKKVEVRGHDVTVRFRLRVDPLIVKRLGDNFE